MLTISCTRADSFLLVHFNGQTNTSVKNFLLGAEHFGTRFENLTPMTLCQCVKIVLFLASIKKSAFKPMFCVLWVQ